MNGLICLQGGREFTDDCRAMDADVLAVSGPGPIAVLAGAARPGTDYAGASGRARRHYEQLGAAVVTVPDPRDDVAAAIDALADDLALLILPGGSPPSLREVLSGPVAARVVALHRSGMSISGASAGAMVLCARMVLPGGGAAVVDGLGLVDGLALPHWTPDSDRGWPVPDDVDLWGLPECGGVIIDRDRSEHAVRAVGQGEPSRRHGGTWEPVPRSPDGPE